jgi:hypothetical protein
MNKQIIQKILLIIILPVFLLPMFVYAENPIAPAGAADNSLIPAGQVSNSKPVPMVTLQNPLKVNSIGGLVQDFVVIFSYIVILFAVLMLIWVGLKFILARGNVEEMKKLKSWLLWIVVGVAIVIGARVIVQVVISTLSASGTIDQRIINSTNNALSGH